MVGSSKEEGKAKENVEFVLESEKERDFCNIDMGSWMVG